MFTKLIKCLLLLLFCQQLNGSVWYVSPSGNDSNAGSSAQPWKTLSLACTRVTTPGDIIHVKAGTYADGTYDLSYGVSIVGDGPTSIISGIDTTTTFSFHGDQSISYLKFIKFKDYTFVGKNLDRVNIHHNTIETMLYLFGASNVDIHHNTIGQPTLDVNYKWGIYVCDIDSMSIRNNYFKNIAMTVEVTAYLATKVKNLFIYNNVMFNLGVNSNEWYGSAIDFGGLTTDTVRNIHIDNNTMIANPGNRHTRIGIYLPVMGYSTDVFIRNNIMQGFRYATIFAAGPEPIIDVIYIENNIFWDNTSDKTQTYCTSDSVYYTNIAPPLHQTDRNNLYENPLLQSSTDFHLTQYSPAVKNGLTIPFITTDYEDNIRNGTFDIGAYGYGIATVIEEPTKTSFIVYPVPFTDHFTIVLDSPGLSEFNMDVCDIQGKIVYRQKLIETITEVNIDKIPSGVYIIRLINSNNSVYSTIKVIKY